MNTKRILTWNLGLFSFYKYWKFLGFKLNGLPVLNEYFQIQYLDFIVFELVKIKPDICVLEEFYTKNDINVMILKLKDSFPYHKVINSWYHKHSILILSKEPINEKEIKNTEFYILEINNIILTPIHLHSFESLKRLDQVERLLSNISNKKVDCLLGDSNIRSSLKLNFFFFKKDVIIYKKLVSKFVDATLKVGHTGKFFLDIDRIFLAKDIKFKNPTCVRVSKKGMDHYPVFVDILL